MGAGFAYMNPLIVVQTSQGLAEYLLREQEEAMAKGVVIGYDTRHNSEQFAKYAASAFLAKGIKVHWFGEYVPTPFVSFAVKHLGAAAGVMITASHVCPLCPLERTLLTGLCNPQNPAQDNGKESSPHHLNSY
jgi:phosphomannomutase